jgi:uncharacterized protein
MRFLHKTEYRRTPWKNGGGETCEICVSPREATLDAFDWRISMAHVRSAGPFSLFPGVDRSLAILDGEGLRVRVGDAAEVQVTKNTAPLRFSGDAQTSAMLLGGAVLDFNVMTRRDRWRHQLHRAVPLQDTTLRISDSDIELWYVACGSVELVGATTDRVVVQEGEAFVVEPGDVCTMHTNQAQALRVVLSPIGG